MRLTQKHTLRSCSKLELKTKTVLGAFTINQNLERLVKASFAMHSLRCCNNHDPGVLAAYWITGTVNFHEESGGGETLEDSSDLNCFTVLHLKVL